MFKKENSKVKNLRTLEKVYQQKLYLQLGLHNINVRTRSSLMKKAKIKRRKKLKKNNLKISPITSASTLLYIEGILARATKVCSGGF